MGDCIDLQELCGHRFKIGTEDGTKTKDVWLLTVECRYGHICPYGGSRLMACTDYRRRGLVTQLLAIPSATMVQDGDDGVNVLFDVQDFDTVAKIMGARKRRHLSEEHKAKLIASNSVHRFKGGTQVRDQDRRSDAA